MAGVSTDDPQVTISFDELTIFTAWFDTAFNFHSMGDNNSIGATPMLIIGKVMPI